MYREIKSMLLALIIFIVSISLLINVAELLLGEIAYKELEDPKYYIEALVSEKHEDKLEGIFGSNRKYLKLKLDDDSIIVLRVSTDEYITTNENENIYIFSNGKDDSIHIEFTNQGFIKYMENKKDINKISIEEFNISTKLEDYYKKNILTNN